MSDFDDEPSAEPAAADDGWDDEGEAPRRRRATSDPAAQAPKATAQEDDWDDEWDEDDRGGRRDLTLVYAVVAAAIVIVLAVVLTRPKDDNSTSSTASNTPSESAAPTAIQKNWQGPVADAVGDKGADAQARVADGPGVYLWTDFWGWHVRSNNSKDVVVTVAADQVRVKKTDDYNDDDEDASTPFKTEAQVTLPAGDGKTGEGFDLGNSESATFTVTIDGANVAADTIKLGGAEGVAESNPVTFTKS